MLLHVEAQTGPILGGFRGGEEWRKGGYEWLRPATTAGVTYHQQDVLAGGAVG